jgi:hypothetical protein
MIAEKYLHWLDIGKKLEVILPSFLECFYIAL